MRIIVREHNTYEHNTQESHPLAAKRSINIIWLQPANESGLIKEPNSRRETDRDTKVARHITSKIVTLLPRASKWNFLTSHKRGCIKIILLKSNY